MSDSIKTSQPAVSIIVLVYNVSQYLTQCLDSLVNQTLKNIEIIIIDDGSTDGSEKICDYYAEKYPFIKVVHQKNAGVGKARKTAISMITGEYCGFCDSDDFVSLNFFEDLYLSAKESYADIVQAGYTMYYNADSMHKNDEKRTADTINRYKGNGYKLREVMLLSPSLLVRRLHRSSMIQQYGIDFDPSIKIAEDLHFACQTILVANKITAIENNGYFYRQNRDGRLTFVGDERMLDLFWLFDKLDDFIKSHNLKKLYVLSHLAINIPLHQLNRVDANLRNTYLSELLKRLTFKCWFRYVISGIIFSIKMRFLKYFLLNLICSVTLLFAAIFRKIKPISVPLLKATLFFRKGGFLNFCKIKKAICKSKNSIYDK